jgi:energy-coupling factor transport system permease protein
VQAASGYYRPGDSWLHRRNPVTKLLALAWVILAAFLLPPAALPLLAVACLALAAVNGLGRPVVRALRIPAVLIASILVVNAFFYPGAVDVIVRLGPVALSWEGIAFGLVTAGRVLVAFIASIAFLQSTLPDDLLEALVARGASHRFAWVILSAVQMVPRLQESAATILEAQQARGLQIGGSLGRRLRALVPLIGPVLLGSLIDVRERTLALEARGFGAGGPRTAYRLVPDPPVDRWLRLVILLGLAAVVLGPLVAPGLGIR